MPRRPRAHTGNHDIMYLTIGLFPRWLRGESVEAHLNNDEGSFESCWYSVCLSYQE